MYFEKCSQCICAIAKIIMLIFISDTVFCDHCEEATPEVYCSDCDLRFCTECDESMHKKV